MPKKENYEEWSKESLITKIFHLGVEVQFVSEELKEITNILLSKETYKK